MLKLYGFSRVNKVAIGNTRDLRVLWALEELGLPFELDGLDHPAGELNTDEFRNINPLEQIPAIDDDGTIVTESGAIVLYLARKTQRLIPSYLAGEAQVLRWCFAAMNSVEPPLLSTIFIDFGGEAKEDGKRIRECSSIGRSACWAGWITGCKDASMLRSTVSPSPTSSWRTS